MLMLASCSHSVEDKELSLDLKGIGKIEGTYTGDMSGGLPNGTGKFTTTEQSGSQWYYEGEFVDGQFEGFGTMEWPALTQRFTGLYEDNELNGEGKHYVNNILVYEGEFKDGLYSGRGTLYNGLEEVVYEGKFRADYPVDMQDFINHAKSVSFNDLADREDVYFGEIIKVSGKVFMVDEADGYVDYRVAQGGKNDRILFCRYTRGGGKAKYAKGDYITIYGLSQGLISHDDEEVADIRLPHITAFVIYND